MNREQELIWAVWFVKVFDISISQAYITKVLKTTNELAIIIMLDIVHSSGQENVAAILQQRKNLHNYLKSEDKNEKGIPNSLMWTSHWLLAFRFSDGNRYKKYLSGLFDKYSDTIDYSEDVDRSRMSDVTIKQYLYGRLRRSSVTIVLLTPSAVNHKKN